MGSESTPKDKEEPAITEDQKGWLYTDADYGELRAAVDACASTDCKAIAKVAMAAKHPAGLLFLNKLCAVDKFWKERNAARSEATLQAVLTKAMSADAAGTP